MHTEYICNMQHDYDISYHGPPVHVCLTWVCLKAEGSSPKFAVQLSCTCLGLCWYFLCTWLAWHSSRFPNTPVTSLFDQQQLSSGTTKYYEESKKLEASADSNRLDAGIYQTTEKLRKKWTDLDGEEAPHHNIWHCEWLDSACLALLQIML